MPKRVLVLLAAHNGIQWVAEQIASIRAQEGVEASILASDDASSDGTYEYLCSAPGVMVLPGRGPHGSAGRNFFHLLARADFTGYDYFAFSDQDDIWFPWKLSRAVDCLEREHCECYSANVYAFWEDGREDLVDKSLPQQELDFLFEGAGPGCTYVMATRLAVQIQGVLQWDPRIPEEVSLHDWFAYAWARSHQFAWFIDETPVMRYRQHGANQLGANVGSTAARTRITQIRSGWYRKQVEALARICGLESHALVGRVLRKTVAGRVRLALNAGKFRRRGRDALALGFVSLIGWF